MQRQGTQYFVTIVSYTVEAKGLAYFCVTTYCELSTVEARWLTIVSYPLLEARWLTIVIYIHEARGLTQYFLSIVSHLLCCYRLSESIQQSINCRLNTEQDRGGYLKYSVYSYLHGVKHILNLRIQTLCLDCWSRCSETVLLHMYLYIPNMNIFMCRIYVN